MASSVRIRLLLVVVSLGAVAAAGVQAQDADPVRRDRPRLILNPRGPSAVVWKLAFSPDSRVLYAGGVDKTVHAWHLADDRPGGPPFATYLRTYRWDISRGVRGAIFAMDVAPTGILAVGGYGAQETQNVGLFSTDRGALFREFPMTQMTDSVSFCPDGTRLAAIDKLGELLIATQDRSGAWSNLVLRKAGDSPSQSVLPVLFLDNNRIAVPDRPDPARTTVGISIYGVSPPTPQGYSLRTPHAGRVASLARAPQGARWASADGAGAIYLWNALEGPTVLKREGGVAQSLAFSPDGARLLAGSLRTDATGTTAEVELWEAATGRRLDSLTVAQSVHVPPVAWSPDGRWIAVQIPGAYEIRVYSVAASRDRPFQGATAAYVPLKGQGRPVRQVAFDAAPGSHLVGFSATGPVPAQAFDLPRVDNQFHPVAPAGVQWRNAKSDVPGGPAAPTWAVRVTPDRRRIDATGPGEAQVTIVLDPLRMGLYRSHCWIADPEGKRFALAVGTDTNYGVYVYRLADGVNGPAGPFTLVRHFRDHNGPITTLCTSSDRKYLASGSDDQTVKVWSLEGLFDASPVRARWGADFRIDNAVGAVRVENVIPAGIAAARNLRNGDLVRAATFQNDELRLVTARGAQAVLKELVAESAPHVEFSLEIDRAGQVLKSPVMPTTRPAWEPVFTLFVSDRNEWAAFTPLGYYTASVMQGDELFGWQINGDLNQAPRILKAANLQQEFDRPQVLRGLLAAGDIPAAFEQAGEMRPPDVLDRAKELAAALPEITIYGVGELQRIEPKAKGARPAFDLFARVTAPRAELEAKYVVSATIDGRPIGAPTPLNRIKGATDYQWRVESPGDFSRVQVRLDSKSAGPGDRRLSSEAEIAVTAAAPPNPGPYPLHLLALSAQSYRGAWAALSFPNADVREFSAQIQAVAGDHYRVHAAPPLVDQAVTPQGVDAAVASLRKAVLDDHLRNPNPHRLVVVFLSGHGWATDDEYYFIAPAVTGNTPADLQAGAIRWSQFAPLFDLPCQKLFLVDTCRSGDIGMLKGAVNPLKRSGCMIFTASATNASSFEDPAVGHGIFTDALLLGLKGEPGRKVKKLACDLFPCPTGEKVVLLGGLVQFATEEVQVRGAQFEQYPQAYPEDLRQNFRRMAAARQGGP